MLGLWKKRKSAALGSTTTAPEPLPLADRKYWDQNGYLVLKDAVDADRRSALQSMVDWHWDNPNGNDHLIDVLTGPNAWKNFRMHEAPPESRAEVYKLNNTFARNPVAREIALTRRIHDALVDLLGGEPVICNTLNFERGSQQTFHLDTWYMPPPVAGKMVAALIALEDIGPDNGPFTYYPGSHAIPPYRFSHGRLNIIDTESDACNAYLHRHIGERGLQPTSLTCNAGDVFLWNDNLFHGGAAITDMTRTRRSMVVHYWRKEDLDPSEIRGEAGGYYLGRTLRGEFTF